MSDDAKAILAGHVADTLRMEGTEDFRMVGGQYIALNRALRNFFNCSHSEADAAIRVLIRRERHEQAGGNERG